MRFLRTLALALALGTSSCFAYDKPNRAYPHYYKDDGEKWLYNDYEFVPENINGIKENNLLPQLHSGYLKRNIVEKDSKGRKVNATDFVRRSIGESAARAYVEGGLELLIKKYGGEMVLDEVALANEAISLFRKDISRDKGRGKYTLDYEGVDNKSLKMQGNGISITLNYGVIGDSRQTLSEFISHYKKSKHYYGDCDDFAMALLSSYEIMRNIASQRKGKFWETLHSGLKRIQVAFVVEQGHAINFLIYYSKDFSRARVMPVEPQLFGTEGIEQNVIVNDGNQLMHIIRNEESNGIKVEKKKILWFYNSTASYLKE